MRGRNCHAVPPRWRFRADVLLARIAHMRRTCEFVPWNCAWSEGRGDINIRFPTADGVPLRIVTPPVSEPDRVARQHRNRVVPRAVVPQTAVCGITDHLAEVNAISVRTGWEVGGDGTLVHIGQVEINSGTTTGQLVVLQAQVLQVGHPGPLEGQGPRKLGAACPRSFNPQQAMPPSVRTPQVKRSPALTEMNLPSTGSAWP